MPQANGGWLSVLLFGLALPVMFVVYGAWSVYRGVRSWHGLCPRPSESLAHAGSSPRIRRFVDRCILPLGLSCLSLGITLGLAGTAALISQSATSALTIAISLTSIASVTLIALTFSVYRYWKPRRLIPAYLRYESHPLPGPPPSRPKAT